MFSTTPYTARIAVSKAGSHLEQDFNAANRDRGQLENAIVNFLTRGEGSLRELPGETLNRLLVRALEARSVQAVACLISAGAEIEGTGFDPGDDAAGFKRLLERAVEMSTSQTSSPADFDEDVKTAVSRLHQSFANLSW